MKIVVNGHLSMQAPITIIVAPRHPVPNLPPGFYEVSRWVDGTGTTTIRCWPADRSSRLDERVPAVGGAAEVQA